MRLWKIAGFVGGIALAAAVQAQPGAGGPRQREDGPRARQVEPGRREAVRERVRRMGPERRDAIRERVRNVNPERRAVVRERVRNVNPEQRAVVRERLRNMDPERRREVVSRLRERRDGMGFPGHRHARPQAHREMRGQRGDRDVVIRRDVPRGELRGGQGPRGGQRFEGERPRRAEGVRVNRGEFAGPQGRGGPVARDRVRIERREIQRPEDRGPQRPRGGPGGGIDEGGPRGPRMERGVGAL